MHNGNTRVVAGRVIIISDRTAAGPIFHIGGRGAWATSTPKRMQSPTVPCRG